MNRWVGTAVGANGTILHTVTGGEAGAGAPVFGAEGGLRILSAAPNPFAQSVRIDYQASAEGPVTASVYDVAGRWVRTLTEGNSVSSSASISWNGLDASGRPVAPGMYFVRPASAGESCQRPLLLLK